MNVSLVSEQSYAEIDGFSTLFPPASISFVEEKSSNKAEIEETSLKLYVMRVG